VTVSPGATVMSACAGFMEFWPPDAFPVAVQTRLSNVKLGGSAPSVTV
jgi:hypothetical protein